MVALRDQGPGPVQAALATVAPTGPAPAAVLAGVFCRYHAGRIGQGLPIGSEMVESARNVVVRQRLSQGSMRWPRCEPGMARAVGPLSGRVDR
jgi:hypothetical protein